MHEIMYRKLKLPIEMEYKEPGILNSDSGLLSIAAVYIATNLFGMMTFYLNV